MFQVGDSTPTGLESTGIKHIPKLQHNKDCEVQA